MRASERNKQLARQDARHAWLRNTRDAIHWVLQVLVVLYLCGVAGFAAAKDEIELVYRIGYFAAAPFLLGGPMFVLLLLGAPPAPCGSALACVSLAIFPLGLPTPYAAAAAWSMIAVHVSILIVRARRRIGPLDAGMYR